MQRLKMFGHFVKWCLSGLFGKLAFIATSILKIQEILRDHVESSKKDFRNSFSYGMLNYVLSMCITVATCMAICTVVYGFDIKVIDIPGISLMVSVALGITTLLYVYCYVSVLYERFLQDYEQTFTILKDNN